MLKHELLIEKYDLGNFDNEAINPKWKRKYERFVSQKESMTPEQIEKESNYLYDLFSDLHNIEPVVDKVEVEKVVEVERKQTDAEKERLSKIDRELSDLKRKNELMDFRKAVAPLDAEALKKQRAKVDKDDTEKLAMIDERLSRLRERFIKAFNDKVAKTPIDQLTQLREEYKDDEELVSIVNDAEKQQKESMTKKQKDEYLTPVRELLESFIEKGHLTYDDLRKHGIKPGYSKIEFRGLKLSKYWMYLNYDVSNLSEAKEIVFGKEKKDEAQD